MSLLRRDICPGVFIFRSEVESRAELDDPRIVAGGNDPTKFTRTAWIDSAGHLIDRLVSDVKVADGICKVHIVEQIESIGPEFEIHRFIYAEMLADRKIDIELRWTT